MVRERVGGYVVLNLFIAIKNGQWYAFDNAHRV